jgi:hypothetical protein
MFTPDTLLQTMYGDVVLFVQTVSLKHEEGFITPGLVVLDSCRGQEVGTGACDTSCGGLQYGAKDMNCDGETDDAESTESATTGCCEHGTAVVESGCCSGDRHLSGLLWPSSPDFITLPVLVVLLLAVVVGVVKDMIIA